MFSELNRKYNYLNENFSELLIKEYCQHKGLRYPKFLK
jgi:hypothetical protein